MAQLAAYRQAQKEKFLKEQADAEAQKKQEEDKAAEEAAKLDKQKKDAEMQDQNQQPQESQGNISLNKSKAFDKDMAMAQRMQAQEFNGNQSRTGANSDDEKNYNDCLAPIDEAAAAAGTGAELDQEAYYNQHGVRQGDVQQEDQLIGGPEDQAAEARYRQFVIEQQRAMAEIRKERERREREDQYDPRMGWAPRLNNNRNNQYSNREMSEEEAPLMNNNRPVRAPYQRQRTNQAVAARTAENEEEDNTILVVSVIAGSVVTVFLIVLLVFLVVK